MTEVVVCPDSGVWVKSLLAEEPASLSEAAVQLLQRTLTADRLVAPSFAWAEVGSVLRKKVRQGQILGEEADTLWASFGKLPIEFIEGPALRTRAWELAAQYGLPTLYDAAFLACTELAAGPPGVARTFWTADRELLRALGRQRPAYVHELGEE